MALKDKMGDFFAPVTKLDIDDVLEPLGLRTRPSFAELVFPAIGFVLAGVAIGAGLGMVFAPTSGQRMREKVQNRLEGMKEKFAKNSFDQTSAGGNIPVNTPEST